MGKENTLDHSLCGYQLIDNVSGNLIRKTENGLKECDLPGISQDNKPLELDENGVPVDWQAPKE